MQAGTATDRRLRGLDLATIAAMVTFAAASLYTVFAGVVNADEGWYVVAADRAMRGQLPYRDFSFTQGPLSLYIFGPLQRLAPGLVSARTASAVLAIAAVALCALTVRRLASAGAALIVVLFILAGAPPVVYFLSITKTYGASAFFAASCFACITSKRRDSWLLPLGVAATVAFAFTRTTGIALAAIVLVYVLARGDRRVRVATVAIGFVSASCERRRV